MIETRAVYIRECDDKPIEGVVVDRFTHRNYGVEKDIVLIFYKDIIGGVERPVLRYVEANDARLTISIITPAIYKANSLYKLLKTYCKDYWPKEYYVEDEIYNFVNYRGLKI